MYNMEGSIYDFKIRTLCSVRTMLCFLLWLMFGPTTSWQQDSLSFQNPGVQTSHPFLSHFQQPSDSFHNGADQFHFQGFQPSSIDSTRHQPSPFIKPSSSSFLSNLQVQPLHQQSQFQRFPANGHDRFVLGRIGLQQTGNNHLLHSNSFPLDLSEVGFNKRFRLPGLEISDSKHGASPVRGFPQQSERPFPSSIFNSNNNISGKPFTSPNRIEVSPQQHHGNGRAPFISEERNANSFGSHEADRVFGTSQHKSRPFTIPTEEQGKDYDYEVRFSGLKANAATNNQLKTKATDVPPITTHRNTDAYLRSQAFVNNNRNPYNQKQRLGEIVDEEKISITTHSVFGNLKDADLDAAPPQGDEEYYDEGDEEFNNENHEEPEPEQENFSNKPLKDESNKENDSSKFDNEEKIFKEHGLDANYEDEIQKDILNEKIVNEHNKIYNAQQDKDVPETEFDSEATTIRTTSPIPNTTTGFDVLTMNPVTMVENDNFKEFVDSGLIDNTEMLAVLDLADQATLKPELNVVKEELNKTKIPIVIDDINLNKGEEDADTDENDYIQLQDETDVLNSKYDNKNNDSYNSDNKKEKHIENEEKKELAENDEVWEDKTPISETTTVNEVKAESTTENVILIHEVVSVVTTKSVINGTILPDIEQPSIILSNNNNSFTNDTEGWFIVGSVQTSKSVSQIKPSSYMDPEEKNVDEFTTEPTDNNNEYTTEVQISELPILQDSVQDVSLSPSTESIIDKLDQLQSELSSGFLTRAFNNISNNIAVLTDMQHTTNITTTDLPPTRETPHRPVVIRKFIPSSRTTTTTSRPRPKPTKMELKEDAELAALLPPGFKIPSYNRKTTIPPSKLANSESRYRNSTTGRSLEQSHNNKIGGQDFVQSNLKLKPNKTTLESKDLQIEKLFGSPKQIDISSLLPPGYKLDQANIKTDIKDILAPVYTTIKSVKEKVKTDNESEHSSIDNLLKNLTFKEINSKLLPQGFNNTEESIEGPDTKSTEKPSSGSGLKVVFPSRPGGRKPISRTNEVHNIGSHGRPATTQRTSTLKAWPSRSTTEFTGWPSPSTTPLSIEKLLELQRTQQISFANKDLLPQGYDPDALNQTTSTSLPTTESTTTSTTTHSPGVCENECSLVGTIRLVGGTAWVPELLDHHTKEWQLLANEVQTELERAYRKSNALKQWFKKIRIDGFSKGSVLVDYFVELAGLPGQLGTVEVKRIFHASLSRAPEPESDEESKNEDDEDDFKLSLGKFLVDPSYTDFVVLPKVPTSTTGYSESDVLFPQWAIAVVVIGLASLCFVIIFGVTVLVNKQKNNQKKTKAVPLTEDMLQELNKNHMGGLDNYGADDLYNVNLEDQWNQPYVKQSKRPMEHDINGSNVYDSWRSQWTRPSQLHPAEIFHDSPWKTPVQGFRSIPSHNVMSVAPNYNSYGDLRTHDVYLNSHHYGPDYQRKRPDYDTNF